ncbi:MAG TPA: hypothetical protein V6C97_20120 [Oculatellaceae cyanobacterium]
MASGFPGFQIQGDMMKETDTRLESEVQRIIEAKLNEIEDDIACKVADRLAPRFQDKKLSKKELREELHKEHEDDDDDDENTEKKMFDPIAGP